MYRIIKNIIIQLRTKGNKISFSSDISLNTSIGSLNRIINSKVYNSTLIDHNIIDNSSVFSGIIGSYCKINTTMIFSCNISGYVSIGANSAISRSTISKFTYLAGNNRIFNARIGSFCSIAENVSLGHAEHPYDQLSTSPAFYKADNPFNETRFFMEEVDEFKETVIGNDVWIGLNAYIKAGVTIGNGCVIGAGTIVTKNIDPYSIVVGVPGKVIKKRFSEEVINKLQNEAWWDLPDQEILEYASKFGNAGVRP